MKPQTPVYVLPNSHFPYAVYRVKESAETPVSLPSSDFAFGTDDESLGEISSRAVVESKDATGLIKVKARDVTVESNEKNGWVHVVAPHRVEMSVTDVTDLVDAEGVSAAGAKLFEEAEVTHRGDIRDAFVDDWTLVQGRYYLVKLFLFDDKQKRISLTDNTQLSFTIDSEFLSTQDQNGIGSRFIVRAERLTRGQQAQGKLEYVTPVDTSVPLFKFQYDRLHSTKVVQITSQVQIDSIPSEIRLPYLGYFEESGHIGKQMWTLTATGGSGQYKWLSENADVAMTSVLGQQTGKGIVHGGQVGATWVTVQDQKNPDNNA